MSSDGHSQVRSAADSSSIDVIANDTLQRSSSNGVALDSAPLDAVEEFSREVQLPVGEEDTRDNRRDNRSGQGGSSPSVVLEESPPLDVAAESSRAPDNQLPISQEEEVQTDERDEDDEEAEAENAFSIERQASLPLRRFAARRALRSTIVLAGGDAEGSYREQMIALGEMRRRQLQLDGRALLEERALQRESARGAHEVDLPFQPERQTASNRFNCSFPSRIGRTDRSSASNVSDISFRNTMDISKQLDQFEICPIDNGALLDPVRLIHDNEEVRIGPPHVMNRKAAEKWLNNDPLQSCPLCRGRVRELRAELPDDANLRTSIQSLVREPFHGGDNLLHKAVKLLDADLFSAVGRFLSCEDVASMLRQKNDEGMTPLGLLGAVHSPRLQLDFVLDLPQSYYHLPPFLKYCPRSACWGGSPIWCNEKPVFAGSRFQGPGQQPFSLFHCVELEKNVQEADVDDSGGVDVDAYVRPHLGVKSGVWGLAVTLHPGDGESKQCICILPVMHPTAPRSDSSFDEEVFEPAIAVMGMGMPEKESVFHGRVAAHRGIWIGGIRHFDDYHTPGLEGACVLVTFDPVRNRWQVFPGEGQAVFIVSEIESQAIASTDESLEKEEPANGESLKNTSASSDEPSRTVDVVDGESLKNTLGAESAGDEAAANEQRRVDENGKARNDCNYFGIAEHEWRKVAAEGSTLNHGGEAVVRLQDTCGNRDIFLRLEPRFILRRWNKEAVADAMQAQVVSPSRAKIMRETLVLVVLSSEQRPAGHFHDVRRCETHLAAVVSEISLGRSDTATIRFSDVMSVSRSHCVLSLQSGHDGEEGNDTVASPRLVAFDDGSLFGTLLNGLPLGVGRSAAMSIEEGCVLQLGTELSLTVQYVSKVLALNDHIALAEFFDRMGERRTATSLREQPRHSERIISSSLGSSLYNSRLRPVLRGARRGHDFAHADH